MTVYEGPYHDITVNGMTQNTTYSFRLRGHDELGTSPWSETVSFTVPVVPEPVVAANNTNNGTTQITVCEEVCTNATAANGTNGTNATDTNATTGNNTANASNGTSCVQVCKVVTVPQPEPMIDLGTGWFKGYAKGQGPLYQPPPVVLC